MADDYENIDFLGIGWSFPPKFNKLFSAVETSTGDKDIKESLAILLGTIPGERFMHPNYGCDIREISFETLNLSLKTILSDKVKTAILLFEPRINIEQVEFEEVRNEGVVFIHLIYKIKTTNSRTNMVYPYYIKEGTNL
ncbi:GPW/gp25 family protein [Vicingaceae bacterium]|nr:GPW/gp25 family protein [Vicingaceae bacterium]